MDISTSAQSILVDLDQLKHIVGLSRTTIYTLPDFPKPIKIGGAGASAQGGARWILSEVHDWIRLRISMRDDPSIPKAKGAGGRPTKKEQAEAKRLGLSIREYRAQKSLDIGDGRAA